MGVVLKVLVKEGPLGIHFLKGIQTKQGTYTMAILGTGVLNNYHIGSYKDNGKEAWKLPIIGFRVYGEGFPWRRVIARQNSYLVYRHCSRGPLVLGSFQQGLRLFKVGTYSLWRYPHCKEDYG